MNDWYIDQLNNGHVLVRGCLGNDGSLYGDLRLYYLNGKGDDRQLVVVTRSASIGDIIEEDIYPADPSGDWRAQCLAQDFRGEPQAKKHVVVWPEHGRKAPVGVGDPRLIFHLGGMLEYLNSVAPMVCYDSDDYTRMVSSGLDKLGGLIGRMYKVWDGFMNLP